MELQNVSAYPCQWPVGWERTPKEQRKRSRYRVGFATSRDGIVSRLTLMGARDIVISSNVQLRRDGLPLASEKEPTDPGVAVYWVVSNEPFAVACDQWEKVRENMRAVCVALNAMSQLESSGASQITRRACLGFKALPAVIDFDWRAYLGRPGWEPASMADIAEAYRQRVRFCHPDLNGGIQEPMIALNRANDMAVAEFKKRSGIEAK